MDSARNSSRVIIIGWDKVLLMRRIKDWIEYYTIPGGWVEYGETTEQTAIREIKEETNLEITLDWIFCKIHDEYHNWTYYLTKNFAGTPKVSWPEGTRINTSNQYYLERINNKELWNIPLFPIEIKQKLIEYFQIY